MAACSRPNSRSPQKGRLTCMLCRLDQPCPRQPKTRSKAAYTARIRGATTRLRGRVHDGMRASGQKPGPVGRQKGVMRRTWSWKAPAVPDSREVGPEVLSSTTWDTSSLDQEMSGYSTSRPPRRGVAQDEIGAGRPARSPRPRSCIRSPDPRLEQMEGAAHGSTPPTDFLASMRRKKTSMMRRYSSSWSTSSSLPASMLGLSLTSMT